MKKILVSIFLILAIILPIISSASPSEISLKQSKDSKNLIQPTIKISYLAKNISDEYMNVGSATGVSILYDKKTKKSYVVTNAHFCEVNELISDGTFFYENYKSPLSKNVNYFKGTLKINKIDKSKDLCLMETESFIKPAKIEKYKYNVSQMEPVVVVGAPSYTFPIVIPTHITANFNRDISPETNQGGRQLLLASFMAFAGQSGSPVFNKENKIIGILFMNLVDGGLDEIYGGIIIPHQDIIDFLE